MMEEDQGREGGNDEDKDDFLTLSVCPLCESCMHGWCAIALCVVSVPPTPYVSARQTHTHTVSPAEAPHKTGNATTVQCWSHARDTG